MEPYQQIYDVLFVNNKTFWDGSSSTDPEKKLQTFNPRYFYSKKEKVASVQHLVSSAAQTSPVHELIYLFDLLYFG